MTSPRADRKTDYRHFPTEYGDMFEQFAREGHVRLGPMPYSKANSSRRDLYRYRLFVINAVEDDPDDTFAREIYDAARNVTLRIDGTEDACFIVMELNPIVAAMRGGSGVQSGADQQPLAEGQSSPDREPLAEGESTHVRSIACPRTKEACDDDRCSPTWCQRQEHYP